MPTRKGTRCGSPRATEATLPSRDLWLCPSLLFPGFVAVSSLCGGFTVSRKKRVASTIPSLLADLGVIGMEPIEPVVLAALVTGEPLLLIGPHGTAKSFLLNRIAVALGLQWRHYNASLLNFDDLVGYPLPNGNGSLQYV